MKSAIYLIAPLLLCASAAFTQTTYVASTGSDANGCTAALPCRTFFTAYNALPTTGGNIVALDSADYSNGASLSITTPLTIDGGDHGAFLTGPANTYALSITPGPGQVTLRNITINAGKGNGSYGIYLVLQGGYLVLDHTAINAFDNTNTTAISGCCTAGSAVKLKHVSIPNSVYGIALRGTAHPTSPYNVILNDVNIHAQAVGVQLSEGALAMSDSSISFSSVALSLAGPVTLPAAVIEHSKFLYNVSGIQTADGTLRLSNSLIAGSVTGLQTFGGTAITFRNNVFAGNVTDGAPSLATSLK